MEQFNITLAGDIELTIKRRWNSKFDSLFDVYIEDKIKGTIYPELGTDRPLVWRSCDNFDPFIVALIGQLIENHDS